MPQRLNAQPNFHLRRAAEKILVSEHEAATEAFTQTHPFDLHRRDQACERSITAMRRLGKFLTKGEIPCDVAEKLAQV